MQPIYARFAAEYSDHDFSEAAAFEAYLWETNGIKPQNNRNGYVLGKKWMDVTISAWREDWGQTLGRKELYEDFPKWFIDKVL